MKNRYGSKIISRCMWVLKIFLVFVPVFSLAVFLFRPYAPPPMEIFFYNYFLNGKIAFPLSRIFFSTDMSKEVSDLPYYDLQINGDQLDRMNQELVGVRRNWYSAFLSKEDARNLPIRVKLRGDGPAHWEGYKKSLWFKTKAGITINNWKRTSLINLKNNQFLVEPFAYNTAKKIGLLFPTNRYVNLFINKVYRGIYHEVVDLDKYYLQSIERTRGDIYYLDQKEYPEKSFESAKYWTKRSSVERLPADNTENLDALLDCLNSFCEHLTDYIIPDQFMKNKLIFELVGSNHLDIFHNHRLYFDPSVGKFEPIIWDLGKISLKEEINRGGDYIGQRLLLDQDLRKRYFEIKYELLSQMITDRYIEDQFAHFKKFLWKSARADKHMGGSFSISFSDWRQSLETHKMTLLTRRNQMMQDLLIKSDEISATIVNKELLIDAPESSVLELLQLKGDSLLNSFRLSFAQKELNLELDENGKVKTANEIMPVWLKSEAQELLDNGKYNRSPAVIKHRVGFKILTPEVDSIKSIVFLNKITKEKIEVTVGRAVDIDFSLANTNIRLIEEKKKKVHHFRSGVHKITEDLVIGVNEEFVADAGAIFLMAPDISIISEGAVSINGTEKNPVQFKSLMEDKAWGVFSILGGKASGKIEHASFMDGKDRVFDSVFFSGMLNCYHADCEIRNSFFGKCYGDDAVNIKSANVVVEDSLFDHTGFDALDIDFGYGIVRNNIFLYSGNDSVDFGTGHANVSGNIIWRSGDKGVSAGEKSYPMIRNNFLLENVIGVAIKDQSELLISNNYFENNETTISAYQKKSQFDGGHAILLNNLINISGDKAKDMLKKDPQSKITQLGNLQVESFGKEFSMPKVSGTELDKVDFISDRVRKKFASLNYTNQTIVKPKRWEEFLRLKRKYE